MKKLFTICAFAFGLFFNTDAQVLATFENPSNDLLVLDEYHSQNNDLFVVAPSVGDNSAKAGLNTSNKCMLAVNIADADWWGNFAELRLKTPVTITEENRYLKFLAYRSIQPKHFRIAINGDHETSNQVYYGKLGKDAEWQGVVADLGANFMGQELTSIVIVLSCNWSDVRTGWGVATYMFDDFELSSNSLPTGVTEVEDLSDFYLNFEDETKTEKWIKTFDMLNAANSYEILNNPVSSEINSTTKVVRFNKGIEASWWQGIRTEFNGALKISDDYKYLHAMIWVPEEALDSRYAVDVQLCAKDFSGAENNQTEAIWDDMVNEWIDVVMEINKLTHLSELTVRFDVRKDGDEYINSPANTFYVDEIVLNDDPDPRSEVVSSLKTIDELPGIKVYGGNNVVKIYSTQASVVCIYNILGTLVGETSITEPTSIAVANGIHIVKIESAGKQKTVKVLVK